MSNKGHYLKALTEKEVFLRQNLDLSDDVFIARLRRHRVVSEDIANELSEVYTSVIF